VKLFQKIQFFTLFLFLCLSSQAQSPEPLSTTSDEEEMVDSLVLSAQPVDQVLTLLQDLTGKTILRQQSIPNVALTLQVQGSIPKKTAIIALESLLQLNGVSILPLSDGLLKAVPIAQASREVPELVVGSLMDRAPSEQVVSKVFILDYLSATEAALLIRPLLSTENLVEWQRRGALLVTDSIVNLQRVESILEEVDVAKARDEIVRFYRLQFVDAPTLAGTLNRLRERSLQSYFGPETVFEADSRSNQLIVITHPSNEALVNSLVEQFDVDAMPITSTEVIYVMHGSAPEVVNLITSLISNQQTSSSDGQDVVDRAAGERGAVTLGEENPLPETLIPDDVVPRLQFSPFASLVADERSNAVVVYGTKTDLRYVRDLVAKIDVLLAQVRIEVVIAEVTLSENQVRGTDVFGIQYNVDDSNEITLAGSADGAQLPLNIGGLAFSALAIKDFSLRTVFNVARGNNDVTVLSAPTIVTTHNKEANINVSQARPIVTGSVTDDTGISSRSTVDFRDIGIQLTVKPLIGNNGNIQMEITQVVENVVSVIEGSGNPDLDGQPIIGVREATSFVSVQDQEIIVLGGLQERTETRTKQKLALLGDIPVIGDWLFSRRTNQVETRELIIFIKPYFLANPSAANEDARRLLELSREKEQIKEIFQEGDFEGTDTLDTEPRSPLRDEEDANEGEEND